MFKNIKFDKNGVWLHSCSLGETTAIAPLVNNSKYNTNLTVITDTGYKEGLKYNNTTVRFLPFEIFLPFWVSQQKALIVMEAELWYMMFLVAKSKGAKTFLINARINTKSYKKYLKFKWFYKKVFANIDVVLAQTDEDKIRLKSLGAKSVKVAGNIKLATTIKTTKTYKKPKALVITAGSTHEDEELIILKAFDALMQETKKLIIVPRHPQRFNEVDKLIQEFIKKKEYSYSRFSHDNSFDSDIILIDMMGELINIYAISDIVILGGGFRAMGGHNPLEPATFGVKLISGDKIFNQKSLFLLIDNYILCTKETLTQSLASYDKIKPSLINATFDFETYNSELKEFINPIKI